MASASPVAILALPERALAERPDSKATDAADGRFAGLMAQFSQPKAAPSPAEAAPPAPTRSLRPAAKRTAPATKAPSESRETGHRAAAAGVLDAGAASSPQVDPTAPKLPASAARAVAPPVPESEVSTQDSSAAAPTPTAAATQAPAGPAATLPTSTPGRQEPLGAPAAAPTAAAPSAPGTAPLSAVPLTAPEAAAATPGDPAPQPSAQAGGPTLLQAVPAEPAQLLPKAVSPPPTTGPAGTAPQAMPNPAPTSAPDATALHPQSPAALEAEPAPKASARPAADPTVLQAALPEPGAGLKLTRATEEPDPGPGAKTASPATAEPTTTKPGLPAEPPQGLAQLLAKATSQPVAAGPEGEIPQATPTPARDATAPDSQAPATPVAAGPERTPPSARPTPAPAATAPSTPTATAPDTPILAAPEAAPAPKTSALPAGPALLQAVLAGPGASLKVTRATEEPTPGPLAKTAASPAAEPTPGKPSLPAALPQELAPLPAKAALPDDAAGVAGTAPQAPPKGSDTPGPLGPAEPKLAPDLLVLAGRALDGASPAMLGTATQRSAEGPAPATAPPPPQPAAAPPSVPVLQVEGGLRWMLKTGAQEAQLQLHPDSLGQVTIHLKVEGGEVHAKVWVTEATSVQAVREGQPHLEQCLKEQGLHLGSFDLQQGHRPFQEAASAPSPRERALPEATPARQEAPAAAPIAILNARHVELYA